MDSKSRSPGVTRRYTAWFGDMLRLSRRARFADTTPRSQLWVRADQQIASQVAALRARSAADLHRLLEAPLTVEVREGRFVVALTAHAHREASGTLTVIVEARESRWGGFAHTVSADGFFLRPDGAIVPMKEEDLWSHGY